MAAHGCYVRGTAVHPRAGCDVCGDGEEVRLDIASFTRLYAGNRI